MNNNAFCIAMADLFAVLSFGFLALVNLPDTAPVIHDIKGVPEGSLLLRKIGGNWQSWNNGNWQPQTTVFKDELLVSCTEHKACLEVFNAESLDEEAVMVALPNKRRQEVEAMFFGNCSKTLCNEITFIHTDKSLQFTQPTN
jgi:hypothetical protein